MKQDSVTLKVVVPAAINLNLKGKHARTLRPGDVSAAGLAYLMVYGIKQQRDVYSGEPDADAAAVAFDARWDGLIAGTIPTGGGGRRGGYATEPIWGAFVAVIRATKVDIQWRDVKKALAGTHGDWERIRVLTQTVGMALSVRANGRNGTKADACARIERAYTAAARIVERDAKDAVSLIA